MKIRILNTILFEIATVFCLVATFCSPAANGSETTLWYEQPAKNWYEAMPLGNGRLGAMVHGGVAGEQLALNEESLWAGCPLDVYPENFTENLREVQRLVLAGKISEARKLGLEKLTKKPTSFRSYQPLADLRIDFQHDGQIEQYRRELDLATGIARINYRAGDTKYCREVLISAVDDVIAVRLSATGPGKLRAKIRLTREKDIKVVADGQNRLCLDGQIVDVAAPEA
ncbi:MAG: glycoside hydrolase family 95 protein, partial [Pirellulales bacterium]|nr:glycoside hydrolase family 95 protein [Pirellulales bacterium]